MSQLQTPDYTVIVVAAVSGVVVTAGAVASWSTYRRRRLDSATANAQPPIPLSTNTSSAANLIP